MKCSIGVSLVVCMAIVTSMVIVLNAEGHSDGLHWRLYKSTYNKTYADPAEESLRRAIFMDNKQKIEQHNAQFSSRQGFKLGYSHLTDWTGEELQRLRGFKMTGDRLEETPQEEEEGPEFLKKMLAVDVKDLPKEVDWRKSGRVGPVKDQGFCASDWAFASTGVLEGQEAKFKISPLEPLSEQNVMDCSPTNRYCDGGFMADAFDDLAANGGIESEADYPYLSPKYHKPPYKCAFNKSKSVMGLKRGLVLPNSEEALQKVVAQFGPVAVALHATPYYIGYRSGILDDKTCSPGYRNHAVLIVGYGTSQDGRDYWILKDSWTEQWGEKGFMRMVRNKGDPCGLATIATIAEF